jgi:transcriptional regulator with XRE-family HTH domain
MEACAQFACHARMDIRLVLGENVRTCRLRAGISQEELAARMGVEQGYISRLEAGSRNPTIVTLAEAAKALGVRPAALLEPLAAPSKGKRPRR